MDGVVSSEIVVANNCREAMYCLFICSGVKKKFFSDCMIIVLKNFFLLYSNLFSTKICRMAMIFLPKLLIEESDIFIS